MNESGIIVKKLVAYFEIPLENILVVHDDTDIRLGKFKIQKIEERLVIKDWNRLSLI